MLQSEIAFFFAVRRFFLQNARPKFFSFVSVYFLMAAFQQVTAA